VSFRLIKFIVGILLMLPFWLEASGGKSDSTGIGSDWEFRIRELNEKRDFSEDAKSFTYALLRARNSLQIHRSSTRLYLQIQYPHVLGWDSHNFDEKSTVDLHQAWIGINLANNNSWLLSLGRMELRYSDERLVSPVDWSNYGRVFDCIRLQYQTNSLWADMFFSSQSERSFSSWPESAPEDYFYGIWGGNKDREFEFFFLVNNLYLKTPERKWRQYLQQFTAGSNYSLQVLNDMKIQTDIAYQFGYEKESELSSSGDQKSAISAYLVRLTLMYSPDILYISNIKGGIDITSGDDIITEERRENFDNLYHDYHRYNGALDIFKDGYDFGLMDVFLGADILPKSNSKVSIEYHLFRSAQSFVRDGLFSSSPLYLGNEIDLIALYKPIPEIEAEIGMNHFYSFTDWNDEGTGNPWFYYIQIKTYLELILQ